MAKGETPSISKSTRASSVYSIGGVKLAAADYLEALSGAAEAAPVYGAPRERQLIRSDLTRRGIAIPPNLEEEKEVATTKRRVVQVFIVDPDENVPLADCLLYKGTEQLTDLTDQELYFEVDIKGVLAAHNEKRIKVTHKALSLNGSKVFLEPARVRDLAMSVVTVATF